MKTISIFTQKGGVGKTISTINIAYTLVKQHEKRVLIIDNDKQGNTSQFFNVHSYEEKSISDLLTNHKLTIQEVIKKTNYEGLDIIPANMNLIRTNKELLLDTSRPQQTRLKKHLEAVWNDYDYCIIDNAPDLTMSVINALVATNDVITPVSADKFAFDGLDFMIDQLEEIKEFNENIQFRGCFITRFSKNNLNRDSKDYFRSEYQMFQTHIRNTVKVGETSYTQMPLLDYSPNCTAAKDYVSLVAELLEMYQ